MINRISRNYIISIVAICIILGFINITYAISFLLGLLISWLSYIRIVKTSDLVLKGYGNKGLIILSFMLSFILIAAVMILCIKVFNIISLFIFIITIVLCKIILIIKEYRKEDKDGN